MSSRDLLSTKVGMVWRSGKVQVLPSREITRAEVTAGAIQDLEGVCGSTARAFLRRQQGNGARPDEVEDLKTFLIGCAWTEGRKFDPATPTNKPRALGPSLDGYICSRLRWRCFDWATTKARERARQPLSTDYYDVDEYDERVQDWHEDEPDAAIDAGGLLGAVVPRLSARGRETLLRVALPHSDGESVASVAARLGRTSKQCLADLADLADEIRRLELEPDDDDLQEMM